MMEPKHDWQWCKPEGCLLEVVVGVTPSGLPVYIAPKLDDTWSLVVRDRRFSDVLLEASKFESIAEAREWAERMIK